MTIPEFLISPNGCEKHVNLCYGCDGAVKRDPESGRWFVTMGHPGFNSAANNFRGYKHKAGAERAVERYGSKGGRR